MAKFILFGVIIGFIIGLITDFSIIVGIALGAVLGGISYAIAVKKNTTHSELNNEKEKQTLQLREECLDIKKNRVQVGEVKIRKDVVEEQKTFTVPVRREEMVIEFGSDEEFRIPLKEEDVEISKHPVKVADVSISKRQIKEMKQVKEAVKKEIAGFDVIGTADVKENEKQ